MLVEQAISSVYRGAELKGCETNNSPEVISSNTDIQGQEGDQISPGLGRDGQSGASNCSVGPVDPRSKVYGVDRRARRHAEFKQKGDDDVP